MDNLKNLRENVKRMNFLKMAGYKINLPFGAVVFDFELTFFCVLDILLLNKPFLESTETVGAGPMSVLS